MIDKQYSEFTLTCDVCGEPAGCTFEGAVKYKTIMGWKSKRESLGWIDICPECLEGD